MKRYPEERKQAVIEKMNGSISLPELAQQEGISIPTLYAWRREARGRGLLMPASDDSPEGWNSVDKFNAVLQTAAMNQEQLARYCRQHGLYPEQIERWKLACQQANDWERKQTAGLERERRQDRKEIKALQAEVSRKDRALAEATAILVLRKKLHALLEDGDQ